MAQKRTTSKPENTSKLQHRHEKKAGFPWLAVGLAGIGILIIAGLFLVIRAKPTRQLPAEITAAEAFQEYQQGAFFLDVRTQQEFQQFHVPKSTNIPLDQLPDRLNELPRDREIVVVCLSGHRSSQGKAILQQAGFARVTCLSGGLQEWHTAGYPLESGT